MRPVFFLIDRIFEFLEVLTILDNFTFDILEKRDHPLFQRIGCWIIFNKVGIIRFLLADLPPEINQLFSWGNIELISEDLTA